MKFKRELIVENDFLLINENLEHEIASLTCSFTIDKLLTYCVDLNNWSEITYEFPSAKCGSLLVPVTTNLLQREFDGLDTFMGCTI